MVILGGIIFLLNSDRNNKNDNQIKSTTYSASTLTAPEDSFDFKTILMKDGNVSHQFKIDNQGTEPIVIEKIYTSCMCTNATVIDMLGKKLGTFGMQGHGQSSTIKIEVGAGEFITIEAVFDPAAHGPSGVGLIDRSVYLETNSAKSPKLELSFRAMVIR